MNEDDYKIELFVFPDGTAIEMIVFDGAGRVPQPQAARETSARGADCRRPSQACAAQERDVPSPPPCEHETDAHTCPVCGSTLVYPVAWERRGPAAWSLELRCPDCELRRETVLGRAAVEQFNRDLYLGAQALAREVERMVRRNFEEEAERIVDALERDLIQPMDF